MKSQQINSPLVLRMRILLPLTAVRLARSQYEGLFLCYPFILCSTQQKVTPRESTLQRTLNGAFTLPPYLSQASPPGSLNWCFICFPFLSPKTNLSCSTRYRRNVSFWCFIRLWLFSFALAPSMSAPTCRSCVGQCRMLALCPPLFSQSTSSSHLLQVFSSPSW